jgi:hypothetical protein
MSVFRYVYAAIFAAALVYATMLDAPWWERVAVLAVTGAPLLLNEVRRRQLRKSAAEQAAHASDSTSDTLLHAYREHG